MKIAIQDKKDKTAKSTKRNNKIENSIIFENDEEYKSRVLVTKSS